MADIEFRQVKKVYGKTPVVHGVDLSVRQGEFLVILGPSGCGKSTLLRMVAGLEAITSGEIAIGGKVVNRLEPRERGCAMVFQNYALYPHMTVAENIGYALRVAGIPRRMRVSRVDKVAQTLGLSEFLDRKPAQLSGGQRQRVAMGRAMIREPKVFLYDEPLSNLDAKLRVAMRLEIRKLHQRLGTTTLFVTHDQVEAMTLADRVVVMNKGVIEQVGTPSEVYHNPESAYVASFIGSPGMNLLPVRRANKNDLQLACGTALPVGGMSRTLPLMPEFTVGVRAESIIARQEGPGIKATVHFTEELGSSRLLHTELGGVPLVVSSRPGDAFEVGRSVVLNFEPQALHFFDSASGQRLRSST